MTPTQGPLRGSLVDDLAARADQLARKPLIQVRAPHPWHGWDRRRLVVVVALLPITAWFFHSAAGAPAVSDLGWSAAIAGLSLMGALVWASYVPATSGTSGSRSSGATPCATMAGIHVITAGMLLSLNPTLSMALPALALQAIALHQRTTGACASR